MTFWRLAFSLAFAAFAVGALGVSVAARSAGPLLERRTRHASPACRATVLFRLRAAPLVLSGVWGFGVVLPTFLWFEPRGTVETTGWALTGAAALGVFLCAGVVWRIARAWMATRRITAEWLRRSRPLSGLDVSLSGHAVDELFPLVAVVGVLRPRLFIAERVLRECSPDEIRAIVAHEAAHVRRRDNLKRLLVRICAGVSGRGWDLQHDWGAATEEAADASALAREPLLRSALAQALVRVARLASPRDLHATANAFYLGGSVESRVRRILDASDFEDPQPYGCALLASVGAVFVLALIAAAPVLHLAVEAAVRLLP